MTQEKRNANTQNGGALYITATPIGNLGDITVRAVETLKSVAKIYCEDTRRARILCDRYVVSTPLQSCHAYSERRTVPSMLRLLATGDSCAYISDAGTPGISDPGSRLAGAARSEGFRVIPLPGASAVHALISASGELSHPYLCYGFLPRGAGRRKRVLSMLLEQEYPFVLFESPYRIIALCEFLASLAPQHAIVIGRELTKRFEEIRTATASMHHAYFLQKKPRGEFSILVTSRKIS